MLLKKTRSIVRISQVLCLAVDSTHFSRSPLALDPNRGTNTGTTPTAPPDPSPLRVYSPSQLEALPERWFGIAMRAMRLGEWETIPRIRSVQVSRLLHVSYLLNRSLICIFMCRQSSSSLNTSNSVRAPEVNLRSSSFGSPELFVSLKSSVFTS